MKCFQNLKRLKIGSNLKYYDLINTKFLKKPYTLFNISPRTFSNETDFKINDEQEKTTKAKKKVSQKSKASILECLEKEINFHEVKDLIPEKLFKQRRVAPEGLYLINKDTAYEILFAILPYLQTLSAGESNLIEVNPGLGLLTDLLLNNWSREITIYESNSQFITALNTLNEAHKNRIHINFANFYDVWKLSHQDKHTSSTKVAALLGDMKQKPWGEEFCSTIIGIAPSNSFLNHLLMSLAFQHSLMMWGRHQFFFVVTPKQYISYTCNRDAGYGFYRASSAIFQILFKFKFLCKVDRKSFLPWVSREKKIDTKTSKLRNLDSDYLYLIRVEPRQNLYDLCKPQDLKQLWYFIRHNMLSRKNKVIPLMERWVPSCGPRLITSPETKNNVESTKTMHVDGFDIITESPLIYERDFYNNMTIFTEIGDLNPSQILSLFLEFKSWPEFSESTFITSMEHLLLKLENPEEILDVEDYDSHSDLHDDKNKIDVDKI